MKNWKKYLACLLAGVLVMAMLTACGGLPATAKATYPSPSECEDLAKTISSDLSYDRTLWNEAYQIASWMTNSISIREKDGEFQRIVAVNNNNWGYVSQDTLNRFLFESDCTAASDDSVTIALRLDDTMETVRDNTSVCAPLLTDVATLRSYAKGKTKMGAAYIVVGDNTYVVAVFQ